MQATAVEQREDAEDDTDDGDDGGGNDGEDGSGSGSGSGSGAERVLPMRGSTQPATTATSLSMLRTPAFLKRQSMLGAARPGLSSARRGTNVSADRVWRYLRSWSTGSSRPGTVAGPARAPPAAALAAKAGAARPASMTPSAATAAATASATSDVTDDHLGSLLVSLGRDGGPWTRSARRD